MFRIRDPQESLWQSQFLVTPKKAKRLERSWAEVFRNEALPLIDEERFAPMYCVDNGRPNRAVQTVGEVGVRHLVRPPFHSFLLFQFKQQGLRHSWAVYSNTTG